MKIGRYAITAAVIALVFSFAAASAAPLPVNVSDYEFLLGTNCTINGQSGTCGVEFGSWTGGGGPVASGWTPFPGTRQGLWKASVNYTGKAKFGGRLGERQLRLVVYEWKNRVVPSSRQCCRLAFTSRMPTVIQGSAPRW
jgi:hypothetical protein